MSTLELSTITTIPKAFMQVSFTLYPVLKKDKELRRLYCYVMNQYIKHGKVVLSAKVLAHIEGKESLHKNKNYCAKAFLDRFESSIMPINFTSYGNSDYSYIQGKAREGTINPQQILIDNWNFSIHGPRIYVDTLRDYSRDSSRAQARFKREKEQLVSKVEPLTEYQRDLLSYLNNLPPHRFNHMLKHLPEAKKVTSTLETPRSRTSTYSKLSDISDCSKPFYAPSVRGRTHRIFGDSFLTLPKKVRNVLTQDWFELDLEQAQLRILASWWQCQPVIDFLDSGKSLWKELEDYIRLILPPNTHISPEQLEELKAANKKLIYSSCYGMGLRNLKSNYKEAFDEIFPSYSIPLTKSIRGKKVLKDGSTRTTRKLSLGEYITSHYLINALLSERQKWIHKVKQEGGAHSPYGFVPLLKGMNPSAVLATIGQAYEQKLMEPIFQLANKSFGLDSRNYKTSKVQIMGWLHDGAFVHFQEKKSVQYEINKLLKAWNNLSLELGISISISISFKGHKWIINPNNTTHISLSSMKPFIDFAMGKTLTPPTIPSSQGLFKPSN